jgi:4-hydroxybenzoate polyprenyltransferase
MQQTPGESIAAPRPGVVRAVLDLSRARQAMLSVAQPALGALLALGHLPAPRVVALGLVAAATGFLAVFSLNDVFDMRSDVGALEVGKAEVEGYDIDTMFLRHPLARGDLSRRFSLVWVIGLGVLSAVCAYALAPLCLVALAAAVALEAVYCALRSRTWMKTAVSGLMVAVGGLAGWIAVAPLSPAALPFLSFLALWEIGGRNLPNDLSDMAADRAVGLTTVATVFGPRKSALSTAWIGAAAIAALGLTMRSPTTMLASVGLGIWAMGVPSVALVRTPTSAQAGRYFNRASLLPALVFLVALVSVSVR